MQNQFEKPLREFKRSTGESPLVQVERKIRAPAFKIFEALSDEDLVKQWWGPEGFYCPVADIDFREGGEYRWCMKSDEFNKEIWSVGRYLEIIPNRKIVSSDSPATAQGKKLNPKQDKVEGPFADNGEAFITFELEALNDNETKLILSHEGLPARMHDDCIDGWSSALGKLKKLAEKH